MYNLEKFKLEEFFLKYEHKKGYINLASSDALPWSHEELAVNIPNYNSLIDKINFKYPDVNNELIPRLEVYYEKLSNKRILPTSGSAEAIFLTILGIICSKRKQINILAPKPAYGAYMGIAKLFNCKIKYYYYDHKQKWHVDFNNTITRSKNFDLVIINNPHNPTGQVIQATDLMNIASTLEANNSFLFVDEVFRLQEEFESAIKLKTKNVIVASSLSKVYGMPGLRFGWVVGPRKLIERMKTLQQYTSLSISSFTAFIGSIAIENIQQISRHDLLSCNRKLLMEWASQHRGLINISAPVGGTTVAMTICKTKESVSDIFLKMFNEKVLLVPGNPNFDVNLNSVWFRLGYGIETEELAKGLEKIIKIILQ